VPIFAGTGSFNDEETVIVRSRAAVEAGARSAMIVMPYYNKPSQAGMCAHVREIARTELPLVLYNVPTRARWWTSPRRRPSASRALPQNVVAVKEATGNVLSASGASCAGSGDRMTVLSGDDALTLPMMACGAKGVISVTSNVLPAQTSRVTRLALEGRFHEAKAAHFELLELHGLLFVEPNPAPAKAALALMGKMSPAVRGPLVPCSEALTGRLQEALGRVGAVK
jgi:4-hydroxy-tetrahydrodipicolinate synthase